MVSKYYSDMFPFRYEREYRVSVELKGVNNNLIQCASLGAIFIGIGEWINHPLQTKIAPGLQLKITSYNRLSSCLGTLFDILGFLVIAVGIWKFR